MGLCISWPGAYPPLCLSLTLCPFHSFLLWHSFFSNIFFADSTPFIPNLSPLHVFFPRLFSYQSLSCSALRYPSSDPPTHTHTPSPLFHIALAIPLALPMSLPLDQHDCSWTCWPTSEGSGALLNPQDLLDIAGLTLATEIRGDR